MAFKFSADQRVIDSRGCMTPEFLRAFNALLARVGGGSKVGPSAPTGLTYAIEAGGVRLNCAKNPVAQEVIAYEWRLGATWVGATVLNPFGPNSILIPSDQAGTYTVWVAAADVRGIYSTPSSMSVTVTNADLGLYGPSVTLATNGLAFVKLKNGGGLTPASILVTAITLNLPSPTYVWKVDGVVQGGAVSASFSLAAFDDADSHVVRCDVTSGSRTAYDVYTIYRVKEGDDAIIAGLSNENHTVLVDSGGTAVAGLPATGVFTVARGAQVLGSGVTYSKVSETGCTATINATNGAYSVTAISADAATVTFRAVVTATGTTLDKVMSLNKSYPGTAGSAGTRGSRTLYAIDAAYTASYDIDGAGAIAAGAASYKAKSTQLIAAAVSGSTPTTPIKGDEVVFSNGSNYVTTYTNDGTYGTNGDNSWALPGTVIDGSLLVSGSVTAAKINVANLAALSALLGNVTIDSSGSLKGGQTAYDTGTGFFLGYSGAAYKFSIGNSAGNKLTWDGSTLSVTGAISVASLTGGTFPSVTYGGTFRVDACSIATGSFGTVEASSVSANTLTSVVATGTAPFTVASTTRSVNLNADLLDGLHATAFALESHNHAGVYLPVAGTAAAAAQISNSGHTYTFSGGSVTGTATATFSGANKPGANSSNIWLAFVIDGTTYYAPAWPA